MSDHLEEVWADGDPAQTGEMVRAAGASLHALLEWFADHEIDAVAATRWRREALDVVRRCSYANATPTHVQRQLFLQLCQREDEIIGTF